MRGLRMLAGVSALVGGPAVACDLDGFAHRYINFGSAPGSQIVSQPTATSQQPAPSPRRDDSGYPPADEWADNNREVARALDADAARRESEFSRIYGEIERDEAESADTAGTGSDAEPSGYGMQPSERITR